MKTKILKVAFAILVLIAFILIYKQLNTRNNNYEQKWAEIEALQEQQLPQSILPKVEAIYKSALRGKNYEQLLKAIIFQLNCIAILEDYEEAANLIINTLKKDAEMLPQPAKSIIYSMLGQMFEEYHKWNKKFIFFRETASLQLQDITTYNESQLIEEAFKYYTLSLQDVEVLQNVPVEEYQAILQRNEDDSYPSTLYDMLANRALSFYSERYYFYSSPLTYAVIDNPDYFSDAQTFCNLNVPSEDTLSFTYQSLKTYQELLRFHLKKSTLTENHINALIDIELRRVSYLMNTGNHAFKDKLYEETLIRMADDYQSFPHNANILLQLGIYYLEQGDRWSNDRNESYKSGYSKAYKLCEQIEQDYPGQITEAVKSLKKQVLEKELEALTEGVQLPNQPFAVRLSFRNIDTIYKTIYHLTDTQAIKFENGENSYRRDKNVLSSFVNSLKTKTLYEQVPLPAVPDYQYHTTDIRMPPLNDGFYLIVFSDTKYWQSSSTYDASLVQVSSLMAQDRNLDNMTTVLVTDRKTGEPIQEAEINTFVYDTIITTHSTFVSDINGIAKKVSPDYTHYRVTAGNKRLIVFNPHYRAKSHREKKTKAVVFTDRSIYRPGQTIYYKAIVYNQSEDKDKKLLKSTAVNVRFKDVNWQVIAQQDLTTNEFGSVDGSFTIPFGLLNGKMTIEIENYGNSVFRVEEYKRPTFEVKFNPTDDIFLLNEQVTVTANAKSFAGNPIDNAKVQYRVVSEEHDFSFFYRETSYGIIKSGILKTDENGDVFIRFSAIAEDGKGDNRFYSYTVTVDVTDVNGETRSAVTKVNIGDKPLLVNTNLPEFVVADKKNNYTVETTNLNDEFTPASVRVEIVALKSPERLFRKQLWEKTVDLPTIPKNEFRRDFPLDMYGNELIPNQFETLRKVADYTLETAKNKRLDFSLLNNSGYYRLKLTANNKKGIVVEHVRYFYYSGDQPEAISNMDHWLTVVKENVEPGEQAEFLIAGGEDESYIYCELVHQFRIIEAKWIKVGRIPEKITFPVKEEYRGGFDILFNMVQNNRLYSFTQPITVPFTNKMLDVKLMTFRNQLLPGEKETWTMLVNNKKGEKETAEIVASLYDASLDALRPHDWNFTSEIYTQQSAEDDYDWHFDAINKASYFSFGNFRDLYFERDLNLNDDKSDVNINWFDKSYQIALGVRNMYIELDIKIEEDIGDSVFYGEESDTSYNPDKDLSKVATRTNFSETAFFFPTLCTNYDRTVLIEFSMPEAITRWKLLSFAHTKDFKIGSYTNELITQKQVAVNVNAPRFFRENDEIELTAKVNNLTDGDLSGQALLRLYDAATMQPVKGGNGRRGEGVNGGTDEGVNGGTGESGTLMFDVKAGGSTGLRWKLVIPAGIEAITYQLTVQAGTHTDGEEKTIPVLTNSILVTETLPFSVRAGKQKTLTFNRLQNNKSKTLQNHSLTLEYTSAPAWHAIQALPYIMEYPHECAEQIFSRYYANTLATTIVNKTPGMKQIFELWNTEDSNTLMSNFEKNQELKQVMLEETPWVMQAQNENERKKRLALLFDMNRMSNEMNRTFNQLKKVQNKDGGFPWFTGMPSDRYITQHIIAGMAHLKKSDAIPWSNISDANEVIMRGLYYISMCINSDYYQLVQSRTNLKKRHINSLHLHYLYAFSSSGYKPEREQKVAYDYFLQQTAQYWGTFTTYEKGLAALVLHRNNQTDKAMSIIRSLKEYAQQSDETGMYWKDNVAGYYWYQAPIETQALLIEAFNEVAKDTKAVEEMKIWLLRNKQTNDWKTTKATSEAIYALLMTGGNLLDESNLLEIEIAGKPLSEVVKEEIRPTPGTGYVKTSWQEGDITPQMGRLKVKNPNNSGIAYGGLYWQYFEQLDKITSAETNLRINKQLFLRTLSSSGEKLQPITETHKVTTASLPLKLTEEQQPVTETQKLKVGDLVRVRIELRADRDYEYVHLKDMRASCFEPVSTNSGYRYQDGLWYYESIKDASINFFIAYLPKGVYVFEYNLRITHVGDFSNGSATIQCMYAPEFSAHSEGLHITVAEF